MKDDSSVNVIHEDSRRYDYYTGQLLDRDKYTVGRKKEHDQLESSGVIRRVKKSEATDGTHVRMKIIAHNKGGLVRWRLVSMEVNQYERHDVFAGTPALTVSSIAEPTLILFRVRSSTPSRQHVQLLRIVMDSWQIVYRETQRSRSNKSISQQE